MKFDLRAARLERGETIAAVVEATGVSRHTIMRIEQGATPQAPTAKKLAEHFEVPVAALYGEPLEPAA